MPDSRSNPLYRLVLGVMTLVAGAAAGRSVQQPSTAAAPAAAAAAAKPAAAAAVSDTEPQHDTAAGRPAKFDYMAARLLALALHDTARYARIQAGDTGRGTGVGTRGGSLLGVTLAMVPDPVDSHEDWLFDAYLEAIRRAYEHRNYVVDQMWLPWGLRADSVLKDDARTPVRSAYPGVLLFRSLADSVSPAMPRWRVVYLVGEVPTAGPHARALARALAERDRLLLDSAGAVRRSDTLDVLGPSFSGSAYGLATALRQWSRGTDRRVRIITASATSATIRGLFPDSDGFSFRATVNSDAALAWVLVRRLVPLLGLKEEQLAILAEGSTAYGQAVAQSTEEVAADRTAGTSPDGHGSLRLFFPLNIAMLRADPAAFRSAHAQPSGAGVTLKLGDAARPMETPPPTSELTGPTVDIALDQIARTLRNHDIRAVAVAASDIRDRIFLVTQLRARLRDVHFIVLENNQLYLAPQYNPDLRGTLVLSSYPLILESQLWRKPGDDLMPFSDESAEALYNATLLQLGDSALVDYELPDGQPGPRRLPVWISVVGGSGLLPLSVLRARDDYATPAGGRVAEAIPDPRLDFLELAIVAGLLSVSLWLLWRNWQHQRKLVDVPVALPPMPAAAWVHGASDHDKARLVRSAGAASLRAQEMLYRFLLVVAVAGGLIPPTVVIFAGALKSTTANADAAAWLAVLAAVALFVAMHLAVTALLKRRRLERHELDRRMALVARGIGTRFRDMWVVNAAARDVVLLLGLLYFGGTMLYTGELAWTAVVHPVRFTLLFFRAWRTDSGVSPLVPLALAATVFVTWCWWHLRRTTALQRTTAFEAACLTRDPTVVLGDPDAPIPDPEWGDFSHWTELVGVPVVFGVRRVRERLFRIVPVPWGGWVALALAVSCVPIFFANDRTLEHVALWRTFDLLYRFGLAAVVAITAWGVFRLIVVWSALKRTLRAVGGTPLITAFERLPQRISRLARLGFIGVPRSTVVAPVAAAQWRHLSRLACALEPGSPPADPGSLSPPCVPADEAELRLAAIGYGRGAPPYPGLGTLGDEAEMGRNFLELTRVLEQFWEGEPGPTEMEDVAEQVKKELGVRHSEPSTSGRFRRTFSADLGLWLRAAEEFAAVHVVDYVEWVISQLRTLAGFLFVSVVLLTVHVNTYPFVPESLVKLLLFTILVLTIVVVIKVMVEMNRDEVLSRVARSEPGRVSWDWTFVLNLLVFGLVPLLTLVSSEFPEIRDFLFAWVPAVTRLAGHG